MAVYVMEPLSRDCATVLQRKEHVCIGVSPFNSYFSTERLASLARWAHEGFASFHFFVPDDISIYTFEALGYPANRARQKARAQARYTHNKIRTAMAAASVPNPGDRVVLGMAALDANPRYRELLDRANRLFADSAPFREACLDATRWVLDGKLPDGRPASPEQLSLGVRYFLAELPLFAGANHIVGADSSLFVYHQRVGFLERFFDRELEWEPLPGQGFLVLREAAGADERHDRVLATAGSAS